MPNIDVRSINAEEVAFQVVDDFFPKEYLDVFYEYNKSQSWQVTGCTTGMYTHLTDPFFEVDCVNFINQKLGINHELYRCHRNGYLPMTVNGSPHYDTHDKADRTLIWYGHEYWNMDWGGENVIGDNDEMYVKPIPNSSAYFSSKHHRHNIRPICFSAEVPRITYIWLLSSR